MGQLTKEQGGWRARKAGLLKQWEAVQPTKTHVFWSWVAVMALTMVLGFTWGGWVTAGTAQTTAETMMQDAVVKRLGPMCVTQFQRSPGKEQKLAELEKTDSWQRSEFIEKQGWATMPGEEKPDSKVAAECERLLLVKK
ncbi:MAG: hypothetical protein WC713_08320 [Candidatus Methylomirabilota bacterium]